jgi:hypothetical protein
VNRDARVDAHQRVADHDEFVGIHTLIPVHVTFLLNVFDELRRYAALSEASDRRML